MVPGTEGVTARAWSCGFTGHASRPMCCRVASVPSGSHNAEHWSVDLTPPPSRLSLCATLHSGVLGIDGKVRNSQARLAAALPLSSCVMHCALA